MILFLFDFLLFISFQVDEGGQLLLQNGRTATDSLFRIQGTVSFQVDNQLIEVGTLLNTSGFDRVGNATNRAEGKKASLAESLAMLRKIQRKGS